MHAKTTIALLGLVLVLAASMAARNETLDGYARFVRADGSFRFSGASAREGLLHLGSWFVPHGPASGFHHVYTQPEALEAWRRTGEFPDGTVLLKELRGHVRADYTTGTDVASATQPTRWFLMVKDRRNRYPDDPLWREGWGWALFEADAPSTNVATGFANDCQGCHLPARDTNWVFVQGYPRLTSGARPHPGAQAPPPAPDAADAGATAPR